MKAQYVLCKSDKTPIQGGWQRRYPTRDAVNRHKEMIGLVPGSVNCMVIDVDKFDDDTLEKIDDQLSDHLIVESPNGYHVWVVIDEERASIKNQRWEAHNGAGDIRGDHGYVILWDRKAVVDWRLSHPRAYHPGEVLDIVGLSFEGSRNTDLNKEVYKAARRGDEAAIAKATEEAMLAGLKEDEIQATVESAREGANRAGHAYSRTRAGLEGMLQDLDVHVRYNTRSMTNQIRYKDLPWTNTSDRVLNQLQDVMQEKFVYATANAFKPMRWPNDLWRVAYGALLWKYECDPFLEYLEAASVNVQWDGVERIDTLLSEMFHADDTPLNRWASGFIFKGAVQRAYQPGAKLDTMPVLIGPQGIGKSSFLREILPMENPEWFSDALNLSAEAKARAEALQGRVVVEVGEMIGATRAELESLKTFLSRTDDGTIRFAYRQNPETMLRRCIIVGTTNDEQCLPNDPTGLRRFLPVTLKRGCNVEKFLDPIREQLWAEAVEWYGNDNKSAAMPYELMEAAKIVTERARRADEVLEDKLDRVASMVDDGELFEADRNKGLSLNEIAHAAQLIPYGTMLDRGTSMRLSNALKIRGWYKRKEPVNGKPINKWYPSNAIPTDTLFD